MASTRRRTLREVEALLAGVTHRLEPTVSVPLTAVTFPPAVGPMRLDFSLGFGHKFGVLMDLLGCSKPPLHPTIAKVLQEFLQVEVVSEKPASAFSVKWEFLEYSYATDSLHLTCSVEVPRTWDSDNLKLIISTRGEGVSRWQVEVDLKPGSFERRYSDPAFYTGLLQCLENDELEATLKQYLLQAMLQRAAHYPVSRLAHLLSEDDF